MRKLKKNIKTNKEKIQKNINENFLKKTMKKKEKNNSNEKFKQKQTIKESHFQKMP